MLHFSISVLISGLTFSIRSTRFALLFIIPPGMTNTLVPPTDKTDSGWWKLGSFGRHYKCFNPLLFDDIRYDFSYPCLHRLHLPAFSFWHFAMKCKKISYLCTRALIHLDLIQCWFSPFLVHHGGVGPGWGLEPSGLSLNGYLSAQLCLWMDPAERKKTLLLPFLNCQTLCSFPEISLAPSKRPLYMYLLT